MLLNSFWTAGAVEVSLDGGRPYFRSVGTVGDGVGDITPGLPTGWRENDIFLLCVESTNNAITGPGGSWAEITDSPQGTGVAGSPGSTRLAVFWKRATSSESAPTVPDTGDHTYGVIAAFADCIETGDPFDDTAGDVEASVSSTLTFPGITTTVDRALVVNLLGHGVSGSVNAPLTNADLVDPTEIFDASTTTGVNGGLAIATGLKLAAGAVGSTTGTMSGARQARITLGLKPRASARPYLVSVGSFAGGVADITPGLPASYASGDIFLLMVETANQAVSAPSGYAAVTNSPQGTGTAGAAGGVRLSVFWKRATGSEVAPTVADTGDHQSAMILCLRGCATSGDPWEASAGDVEASASATITFPAVTTLGTDRLIVQMAANDADLSGPQVSAWANSTMQFLCEVADNFSGSNTGGGLAAGVGGMNTAGSTGSSTATGPNATQGRITLAFPPA